MNISARNIFEGIIKSMVKGAVNTEVTMTLSDGTAVTSTVTNEAAGRLGLKEGLPAFAIIKASSVIVGTKLHDARLSARNIICGKVSRLTDGPVSTEVEIEIGCGKTISAVITHESMGELGLEPGKEACAIFKASSVILGVD